MKKKLRELERWRDILLTAGADHPTGGEAVALRSPILCRREELFTVDREISLILNSGFV